MSQLNRREFVLAAGAATAALCVLGVESAHAAPSAGTLDVGTIADYPNNVISDKFVKPHKLFVIRKGDQIYAASAVCTHKGCVLAPKDAATIKCRCHGSTFSDMGTVTGGPAKSSLFRYAIKLNEQKHLIVDKSKQFAERQWDDPNSFVKVS